MIIFNQLPISIPFLEGIADLLGGIDIISYIFNFLSQFTFVVDIIIAAAIVGALIRGIFKKFWKVAWRGVIFVILLLVLVSLAGTLAPYIGSIPIPLRGVVNGNNVEYANLAQIIHGVTVEAGHNEVYATAFTDVVLKNLVIFFGVPLLSIVTPIISAITFPLFNLLLPKKLKTAKLVFARIGISLGLTFIALMVFSVPMATLVPPMTAVKETMTEGTLLYKFLHPEIINFLELFTKEKSVMLKIVDLGNIAGSINVFASFEVDGVSHELSTAIPALLEELKTIPYEAPPSA
ncbi:MAG: hypothetical protein BWY30_01118 [Tenericutes bacterium ADurb.Bin239]|jgi:hypothetical protein|nr:MAG: hypothetical protein BWY30_01118 [Tenericutes bacterium ADurb.Bin239]